jgi:hypothetical protein
MMRNPVQTGDRAMGIGQCLARCIAGSGSRNAKAKDAILQIVARRKDLDGRRDHAAQASENFDFVDVGQPEIENDELVADSLAGRKPNRPSCATSTA